MESQQNSIWNFFRWGIYNSPEELFDILNMPSNNLNTSKEAPKPMTAKQEEKFNKSQFPGIIFPPKK